MRYQGLVSDEQLEKFCDCLQEFMAKNNMTSTQLAVLIAFTNESLKQQGFVISRKTDDTRAES